MGLNWRGTWNANVVYYTDDVTYYNGSSYVALLGCINIPPTDSNTWDIVAYQGTPGSRGATGIQGPPGESGASGERGIQGATGTTVVIPGPQGVQGIQGVIGAPGQPGTPGARGVQGIQGEQGVRGIQGNPGPVGDTGISFVWAGNWASGHHYVPGQCVAYANSSYACLNPVASTVTPAVDTTNWAEMLSANYTSVNADWNASSGAAEIFNKPTLGTAAAENVTAFDPSGSAATVQTNLNTEIARAEAVETTKASTVMAIAYAIALGG